MNYNKFYTFYEYIVSNEYNSIKLSTFLNECYNYSSRTISFIKRNGLSLVNDEKVNMNFVLNRGDIVKIYFPFEDYGKVNGNVNFEVIYEDEDILVVDKPPFTVTHMTSTHTEDTLANGIYAMWENEGKKNKARFVTRLDRDTSGIVVVAKNKYVHHFIQNQGVNNKIDKKYMLITENIPKEEQGYNDKGIKRAEENSIERIACENGKKAITKYKVLEDYKTHALVEAKLLTGRTHQLRVHFKYIGCPLLGDTLYNKESDVICRQALHSYYISFIHPRTLKKVTFESKLPPDFLNAIEIIKS